MLGSSSHSISVWSAQRLAGAAAVPGEDSAPFLTVPSHRLLQLIPTSANPRMEVASPGANLCGVCSESLTGPRAHFCLSPQPPLSLQHVSVGFAIAFSLTFLGYLLRSRISLSLKKDFPVCLPYAVCYIELVVSWKSKRRPLKSLFSAQDLTPKFLLLNSPLVLKMPFRP